MDNKKNKNLIYTPKHHIPLGEPCTMEDGSPGVSLKHHNIFEKINAYDYIELLFGNEIWSYIIKRNVGRPCETTTDNKN